MTPEKDRYAVRLRLRPTMGPVAMIFGLLALAVGLCYAGISAYWASGGQALLETVGGVFEEAGRSKAEWVVAGLWVVVAVKVLAAALPISTLRWPPPPSWRHTVRALAWVAVATLTLYGLVLTVVDLLSMAGIIGGSTGKDELALTWHALLWDPWFLLWGLLGVAALGCGRRPHPADRTGA